MNVLTKINVLEQQLCVYTKLLTDLLLAAKLAFSACDTMRSNANTLLETPKSFIKITSAAYEKPKLHMFDGQQRL